MADILSYAGDVLWIVVMAIIASTSRAALKRIPPGTRMPMQWSVTRKPSWRAPRDAAFTLMIGLPFVVGLLLLFAGRTAPDSPDEALIIFLVRASVAPLMALIHLIWLRLALKTLDDEGVLKP
jgi:hypothetical protein